MTLSEEIQTIVHAFDDTGRRNAIRDLAKRVKALEDEIAALKSHFAYCTRGCDACSEGLELVKDAP